MFNSPLNLVDPSGHDPLDSEWEEQFEQNHGRPPTDEDRQDRLFSVIFPGSGANGEWLQEDLDFYNANKHDLWENNIDWRHNTAAFGVDRFISGLERLSSFYSLNETSQYVRAVGLFWAGVSYSDPLVIASWNSRGGPEMRHFRERSDNWRESLVDDRDPSHHYAAFLLAGYFYGSGPASAVNWGRDHDNDNQADIDLGNLASIQGNRLRNGYFNLYETGQATKHFIDARPGIWSADSPGFRGPMSPYNFFSSN